MNPLRGSFLDQINPEDLDLKSETLQGGHEVGGRTQGVGAWYVSNVSIIFDCSMLLYYPFWMFMSFILHIYIIFGTNQLTGGPSRIAVLLPISVFRRKGISNGVQTEWNLREHDFLNEQDPGDLDPTSRKKRGGHEVGARPPPSWLPRGFLDRGSKSPGSYLMRKSRFRRFHSVWTPFDILFLRNTEIGKKTAILGWASS